MQTQCQPKISKQSENPVNPTTIAILKNRILGIESAVVIIIKSLIRFILETCDGLNEISKEEKSTINASEHKNFHPSIPCIFNKMLSEETSSSNDEE
jgi:hypothetical protein